MRRRWSGLMAVRRGEGFLLLGLVLVLAAPGRARPIPRSLAELAARSDVIFMGRCEAVSSHWNKARSRILTANRFRVSRVLKGAPGATVTLEELGGVVGNKGMQVLGVPRYRVGDEVLLCAHRTLLGRWQTLGAGQGRFRLFRDARGRSWVQSDFYRRELAAMNPDGSGQSHAPLEVFAGRLLAAPHQEIR